MDDGTGRVAPSCLDNDYKNQLGKPVQTNPTHSQRDSNRSKELRSGPEGRPNGGVMGPRCYKKKPFTLYKLVLEHTLEHTLEYTSKWALTSSSSFSLRHIGSRLLEIFDCENSDNLI